jgi:hypothetical protein
MVQIALTVSLKEIAGEKHPSTMILRNERNQKLPHGVGLQQTP